MKNLSCLLLSISLTACTTPVAKQYVPPISGETASLRFNNNSRLHYFEPAIYETSTNCMGRSHLEQIKPNKSTNLVIPAGKELTFQYYLTSVYTGNGGAYCLLNLRFVPKPGSTYTFDAGTDSNSNKCIWRMLETTNIKKPKKVKLEVINWKAGWTDNSAFCKS